MIGNNSLASASPDLAFFSIDGILDSILSRSESINSVSTISLSSTGLIVPFT